MYRNLYIPYKVDSNHSDNKSETRFASMPLESCRRAHAPAEGREGMCISKRGAIATLITSPCGSKKRQEERRESNTCKP